jgi:mono/diheme cytochrome c family protein
MKKILKGLLYAVAALVAVAAAGALYVHLAGIPSYPVQRVEFKVDVTPERVARGRRTVTALCASCHNDPATGGLTGRLMEDAPPQFGTIYSSNITEDREYGIGAWTDGEIAYLIRTGIARDGRYTPPWMLKLPLLADEDLRDIIAFLRSDDPLVQPRHVQARKPVPSLFTKFLARVAFKPLPYPTREIVAPAASDKVAYGRYLMVARLDCYGCHSRDFASVDMLVPESSKGYLGGGNAMRNRDGQTVYTSNLTPDPTGIGGWTEQDFHRTLKLGLRPDGRALRYPMSARADLTDDEIAAMWAYLRTVPAIANRVAPPPSESIDAADAGQAAYHKYGCNACHGNDGGGAHDLRRAAANYPTDDALIGWIRHPERTRPGISMPTWDGTIEEPEYAPLARYVRTLSEERMKGAAVVVGKASAGASK